MIVVKLKHWRTVGAAAAIGLAACGGEGGERSAGASSGGGEAGEGAETAPASTAATAPSSGGGGEQGEAGAASAYAGLSGDQLIALRLQHLKGFIMAAEAIAQNGAAEDAGILVQQGVLEVYTPAPDQFGSLNIQTVRAAGEPGGDIQAKLRAAHRAIDAAERGLQADNAVLAARMVDIATGLYQGVNQADYVDAIEYQHSHGAALAAQDALADGAADLRRRDTAAFNDARTELGRFVALWPSATAPERPPSYRDVLAQGSRVRLALSPYL